MPITLKPARAEGLSVIALLTTSVIIHRMSGDTKFDYGDQVQVKDEKHKNRFGDVVGMTITASSRTYTV